LGGVWWITHRREKVAAEERAEKRAAEKHAAEKRRNDRSSQ
jgi:hypothetical protein